MSIVLPPQARVLIITSWAPPMIGGPQNFYNLFSQLPAEQYCLVTSAATISDGLFHGGRWLDGEYHFFDASKKTKDDFQAASVTTPTASSLRSRMSRLVPGATPLYRIYFTLRRTWQMMRTGVRSARLHHSPLIVGISDHGPAMIATWLTATLLRRPHMYYLYDIYRGNNFEISARILAAIFEPVIMKSAARVIVTNDRTADFYQQRYGQSVRTAIVYNSVFTEEYEKQRSSYQPRPPYLIIFTGHVYWAQEQSVLNLINAMKLLTDLPLKLELYVPKPPASLIKAIEGLPNVHITSAPQSEMPLVQSRATLLFLPLAWHTRAPDIIATATPGKFTDYLASGRPMLIHAPAYAYVSQYARKHQLGIVVDQDDVDSLAATIRSFLKRPEQGQRLTENALRIFQQNHDARKNAEKLATILASV